MHRVKNRPLERTTRVSKPHGSTNSTSTVSQRKVHSLQHVNSSKRINNTQSTLQRRHNSSFVVSPHQSLHSGILAKNNHKRLNNNQRRLFSSESSLSTSSNASSSGSSLATLTDDTNKEQKKDTSHHRKQKFISSLAAGTEHIPEDPSSLEYYHFTRPITGHTTSFLHILPTQVDAYMQLIKHPMGQIILSQWISNHISLQIRDVLENPNKQIYTKANNLLVGYDLDSEFARDIGADVPQYKSDDPRSDENQKELILSGRHSTPDWSKISIGDYGYIHLDPHNETYEEKLHAWQIKKNKYDEWKRLCQDEDVVNSGMKRAQIRANDIQQDILRPSYKQYNDDDDDNDKYKTLRQVYKNLSTIVSATYRGSKAFVSVIVSMITFMIRNDSDTIKKHIIDKIRPPPFSVISEKVYNTSVLIFKSIQALSINISNIISHTYQQYRPLMRRTCIKYMKKHSERLQSLLYPILNTTNSTNIYIKRFSKWYDEWFGTKLSKSKIVNKIDQVSTFPILSQVVEDPGPRPVPPKSNPLPSYITPQYILDHIRPTYDTVGDILSQCDIDKHRLLLSYMHKQRPTTTLTLGLVPEVYNIDNIKNDIFIEKYNGGDIIYQRHTTIPELVLFSTQHDQIHKQAGLLQHPDIWISQRILNKIPSPNLADIGALVHKIDPKFKPSFVERSYKQLLIEFGASFTIGVLLYQCLQLFEYKDIIYDLIDLKKNNPDVFKIYFDAVIFEHVTKAKLSIGSFIYNTTGKQLDGFTPNDVQEEFIKFENRIKDRLQEALDAEDALLNPKIPHKTRLSQDEYERLLNTLADEKVNLQQKIASGEIPGLPTDALEQIRRDKELRRLNSNNNTNMSNSDHTNDNNNSNNSNNNSIIDGIKPPQQYPEWYIKAREIQKLPHELQPHHIAAVERLRLEQENQQNNIDNIQDNINTITHAFNDKISQINTKL